MSAKWQAALDKWLKTNPKTTPIEDARLYTEFNRRFPKEGLSSMTLEQYALGTDTSKDSFCYWLEHATEPLGSIRGGSSVKFSVWYDRKLGQWRFKGYKSAEDAMKGVINGIIALIEAVDQDQLDQLDEIGTRMMGSHRNSMRAKPLFLYFPDKFIPVINPTHLTYFLHVFNQTPRGELMALNSQLFNYMKSRSEFQDFSPLMMMRFLYDSFPPNSEQGKLFENSLKQFAGFARSPAYSSEERNYKEHLTAVLGPALNAKGDPASYLASLRQAFRICSKEISNLSHWSEKDDFEKVLAKAPALQIQTMLTNLFNSDTDLDIRIDNFKKAVDQVYENAGITERRAHLGLISVLLFAQVKENYIIFRASLVDKACKDWGLVRPEGITIGQEYQSYLSFAAQLKEKLSKALSREADWIDVHTLLWWNYKQSSPDILIPKEFEELWKLAEYTPNIILCGPPGTGKTWLVDQFTTYYLLYHNVSSKAAEDYWSAYKAKDMEQVKKRRQKVRSTGDVQSDEVNFWWINARQSVWDWNELFSKGEEFFEKLNIKRNFAEAKTGDWVFGYVPHPTKQMSFIAKIKEELHQENKLVKKDGEEIKEEVEGITIESFKKLVKPVDWLKIADNPVLQKSEPVRIKARGTFFRLERTEAEKLIEILNAEGNSIELPNDSNQNYLEMVTFHPSYAYEEFVEGIKPKLTQNDENEDTIIYEVTPGSFRHICNLAEIDWRAGRQRKYILVIDEINRANIAKVFGELITLIEKDKRLGASHEARVRLPYSSSIDREQGFGVPPNLLILGTMNTADRSIALLDIALRRRFAFMEIKPDPELLDTIDGIDLNALLSQLNTRIKAILDPDHCIGHSYLMNLDDNTENLTFAWYHQIIPLLQEYFYNDGERLQAVLGKDFVRKIVPDKSIQSALGENIDLQDRFEIVKRYGDDFIEALQKLAS